jgi:hypothetical protein
VYDAAPPALNVNELPTQIALVEAPAVTGGKLITVTEDVAELVQVPLLPMMVYVVFAIGATEILAPVEAPGFQV